jgi:uncharacterized protein (DUF2235 family)
VARNLIVCLDGTRNEPESGMTNVVRAYDIAVKNGQQIVYYDPGVGTMGARAALTRAGQYLTRTGGLIVGYGVKENLEEAYRFLMENYRAGDQIYILGFSRGAYTGHALAGLLRTVGLLRPGANNLIPYALKLYTKAGRTGHTKQADANFWAARTEFDERFGNPEFPDRFAKQIHFLGTWDTVKAVGGLNWKARYEQASWPFTRKLTNVRHGRHALALDERRKPYREYRFDPGEVAKGHLREMWFAGVHSDVGGHFPDHRLSDIALKWIVDEAMSVGFSTDQERYENHLGVHLGQPLPEDHALGRIHANGIGWAVLAAGWHRREIRPGDEIHPSVHHRVAATADLPEPYRPQLSLATTTPRGTAGPLPEGMSSARSRRIRMQ